MREADKLKITTIAHEANIKLADGDYGDGSRAEQTWIRNVAARIHSEILGQEGITQETALLMAIGLWHCSYWGFEELEWIAE